MSLNPYIVQIGHRISGFKRMYHEITLNECKQLLNELKTIHPYTDLAIHYTDETDIEKIAILKAGRFKKIIDDCQNEGWADEEFEKIKIELQSKLNDAKPPYYTTRTRKVITQESTIRDLKFFRYGTVLDHVKEGCEYVKEHLESLNVDGTTSS